MPTYSDNILVDTEGRDVGSTTARVDLYARNIDVAGAVTLTGSVPSFAGALASYTFATLPVAGTVGRLARVTDNVRGIWIDTGVQWIPLNGGVINVLDFGAKGDGVTDDTVSIQAAINAVAGNGRAVFLPRGDYKVTSIITVASDRTHIIGAGIYATKISFGPSGTDTCFSFTNGALELYQCSIRNLCIVGSGSQIKTAIKLSDVSEFLIEDVVINPLNGGGDSKGIHILGKELIRLSRVTVFADKPIVIQANPNGVAADLDSSSFSNLYLYSSSATSAAIEIVSGCDNVIDWTIEGQNIFSGGKDCIRWIDTAAAFGLARLCGGWHFSGFRWENPIAAGGHFLDIESTNNIIENISVADFVQGASHGYKLRNVRNFSALNCLFLGGSGNFIDADSTCRRIWHQNCRGAAGTTVSVTGLEEIIALPGAATELVPGFAFYDNNTDRLFRILGINSYRKVGSLANGANVQLTLSHHGAPLARGIVHVIFDGGGINVEGGCALIQSDGTEIKASGTANFNVGNVAGAGNVDCVSATEVRLRNNLPYTASYIVLVEWLNQ